MIPNVLGIDPSSVAVGWALIHDGEYVESGVWRSDYDDFGLRRRSLSKQAAAFFETVGEDHRLPIDVVAVERVRGFRGGRTDNVLGTMSDMMEDAADSIGLMYLPVYPSEWHAESKRYLGERLGSGGGVVVPKAISQRAAHLLTGNEKMCEDECDALWIAKYVSRVGISNRMKREAVGG